MLYRSIVILMAVALFASGCSRFALPPPVSMAKFVRDPSIDPTNGKVAITSLMGMLLVHDEDENSDGPESMLPFFGSEGALSVWIGDHYDLTLSVHSALLLALEGNAAFISDGGFRLGFIHGFGLALGGTLWESMEDNFDVDVFYDASAGIVAQFRTQPMEILFFGLRYTYATWKEFGGLQEEHPEETATHYLTASIGYTWSMEKLRSTFELVVHYGHSWVDVFGDSRVTDVWIILPSFTFSADY